jgi:hypothetical protein
MDIGKRSALTALGIAAFVLLGVGSMRRSSSSSDGGGATVTVTSSTTATTTPTASADPTDVPDPTTDYKTIDEAKLDGNKSFGKTLLLRVWRGTTEASTVTLYGCGKLAGGYLDASYAVAQRPLVKAIPTTIPMHEHCPRVVVKITGKQPYTTELKGELQQILDLVPAEPETLPPGVDYVSMDDVNIDGKKAVGKIVQLRAYRGNLEEKKFTLYPCGHSGGLNFVNVTFTAAQKDIVKDFTDSIMSCQSIKVKLTTQTYGSTWNAQLIDTVKD